MNQPDWIVLVITLLAIITYGLFKSRTSRNLDGYFLSNRSMPWGLVLLSIMGTQASAITFLSAPGQAYTDGMRFVKNFSTQLNILPIMHLVRVTLMDTDFFRIRRHI